ncbi:hypothetical protein CIHG_04619 [Coccidioides immitis H538.4]|uniref:Uncharacterized protein n=1 Tax=Coccidioides immitis H538.4 TaxID=396776 RepID=A0A0J8RP07_COCIT|nr:hypothetical protein CIHG_04619 [Coccidioides immitis H538.4]
MAFRQEGPPVADSAGTVETHSLIKILRRVSHQGGGASESSDGCGGRIATDSRSLAHGAFKVAFCASPGGNLFVHARWPQINAERLFNFRFAASKHLAEAGEVVVFTW